jgi:hypothetical protein
MSEVVSVATVRQQNITNTTILCKLERKIQEFERNDRLRNHIVSFLSQEINYSHLNQTNKTIVANMCNNFKNVPPVAVSYTTFDFSDQQLAGFLEVLCAF